MATSTMPVELDLPGRVRNMRLAPSNALFALFEAVVNSIHAILDGPEPDKGRILIRVLRDSPDLAIQGGPKLGPIVGFDIEDNGIGFDDANFLSFRRSDSTTKARYGGKGVGRLLWLKVFTTVQITSVYEQEGKLNKREFTFTTAGISKPVDTPTNEKRQTTVKLRSPASNYKPALQHDSETLARSTIEHCLEYFIDDVRPKVFLIDPDAGFDAELGLLFQDELKSEIKRDEFVLNGADFRITHLLVRGRKNSRHALHFCADSRRVKDEPLSGKIPGLSGGLRTAGSSEDLAYQGYVSGALLDGLVGIERAHFDFDGLFAAESEVPPDGTVSYEKLLEAATEHAKRFLDPILSPILENNRARIRQQIEASFPQYRYLLKHRGEDVAAIPPGVEGRELDLALYKIEQRLDVESREALSHELAEQNDPDEPVEARRERLDRLLEQLNDSGMSKLARHVAYRRAVIAFLEDQLGLQTNGKYSLEEAVHAAVCPTRTTSDDLPAAKMNLWLLDDRLYFHYYLASDLPFKDMKETVARDSEDRPDLAIFHRPMAFSDSLDQINAVVLVEFKRPARNDFKLDDPEKNPVSQILRYITTLREGNGRGPRGQTISIRPGTPFYAYLVADLTPSLRKLLEDLDFMQTPDGDGYFFFHRRYNCYTEVLSFQKMIRDAKKRNQAFFDKLNLPLHQ